MMRDVEKTIGNLIAKRKTAYISSVDEDGFPNTKAMLPARKMVGIKEFYFSTNTSSMRTEQYRKNPKACIYYADTRFFRGVMLKGTMEVLTDAAIKHECWHMGDERYYSKGKDDPDYCILKFTAQSGRYYAIFKKESFTVE